MKHTPAKEVDMFPPGTYEAVVGRAEEKTSQAGNEMIELVLRVYGPDGATIPVYDYLISADSSAWKIRHFCKSAGLDYEKGDLSTGECDGQNVRVILAITKDKNGKYPDKNTVKDYLERNGNAKDGGPDDDIPF
jgi:hypothetical protein